MRDVLPIAVYLEVGRFVCDIVLWVVGMYVLIGVPCLLMRIFCGPDPIAQHQREVEGRRQLAKFSQINEQASEIERLRGLLAEHTSR